MGSKKGKKGRKIDRNRKKCEKYRNAGVREKNKARKAAKRAKKEVYFAKRRALRELKKAA